MMPPASLHLASRLLHATAFLLGVSVLFVGCTDNAGALFGGGGDPGGGGGGGGNNTPPADPIPPVDGAVLVGGAPEVEAIFPANNSIGVNVKTPIAIWFSESLDLTQVQEDNLKLRVKGGASSLSYAVSAFNGDRGFVLNPVADLNVDTEYEIFFTEDLVDISGERLDVGDGKVLASFKTASDSFGVAPELIGSFPPDTSIDQSNNYSLVLVFSKPIDFLGVSAAVSISTTSGAGDFTVPEISSSEQVVEFPHGDEANDLGVGVSVDVLDTIVDLESGAPLATTFSASWDTLNFAAPTSLGNNGELFVNLANYINFPTNVELGVTSILGDEVQLQIWDVFGLSQFSDQRSTAENGATTVPFVTDMSDAVLGLPAFNDGPITIAAWVERDGQPSTVKVLGTVIQDTTPPVLSQMGPPFTGVSTRFRTDLGRVRPYGKASEPILSVDVTYPVGGATSSRIAGSSLDGFFIGNNFDPGVADGTPTAFEISLTDLAGNQMVESVQCNAYQRSFIGATTSTGDITVEVVDAQSLAPIPGAVVYVEDYQTTFVAAGSRNEDSAATGSDGRTSFAGRTGAQSVTVIANGYHTFSLLGSSAEFVSLPIRPESWGSVSLAPSVDAGLSGEVTFASGMFADAPGVPSPDGLEEATLPLSFQTYLAMADRPGWFAAFHEVEIYAGGGHTYFDLFAVEPRILLDAPPSSGGNTVAPLLSFGSSTNATNGTTDSIFNFDVSGGSGYDGPRSAGSITTISAIPGITSSAITGVGALSGGSTRGEVEMEMALHLAAAAEGAVAGSTDAQIFVVDDDGDQTLVRFGVIGDLTTGFTNQAVSVAGISEPLPPSNSAASGPLMWPDIELLFPDVLSDTIDGSEDWYHLTLADSNTPVGEWDIWLNADSDSADESVILPALASASGSASDGSPLLTTAGSSWTLAVAAFNLDSSLFPSANGTFFASLFRDCESWSNSVPGTPFNVQ